jgi:hypothetical protein
MALSVPYLAAAKLFLALPTPVTSAATTPELLTRFVNAVTEPVVP